MRLCCVPCLDIRLDICGGVTESVFPEVESMLMGSSDFQNALEFVAAKKKMNRYLSVIDFLFCEIFVEYRNACFRFYHGNGTPLREIATQEEIDRFSKILVVAIKIAYTKFSEKRSSSWKSFRTEVLNVAA